MDLPSKTEILSQIEQICGSEPLSRSKRGCELLRYLATAAVDGTRGGELKETVIGADVFKRTLYYNPKKDAIVRVSVGELRDRLERYYATTGRNDLVRIRLVPGSYVPVASYEVNAFAFKLNDKAALQLANAKVAISKRTLQGHALALRNLNAALRDHPGHSRLLSVKAMVHAARAMYGFHPRTELEEAERLIEEAKLYEHEPWERSLAEAWLRMTLYFDWAGAELLFNRAIHLSHGEARYNSWYTAFLSSQLRFPECIRILTEAVTHYGQDHAFARGDLALGQIVAGKLNDAEDTLDATLELFPEAHYLPYLHRAILFEARGQYAAAVNAFEAVPITAAQSTIGIGLRYLFIGLNGDKRTASDGYNQLKAAKRSGGAFIPSSQVANAAIGAGDYEGAAAYFRDSAELERDPIVNWIAILPFERHLRHNDNFRQLVTKTLKLKFPDERFSSAHT